MPESSNQSIAEILRQIGEYLAMQHVQFKPRAFEKAAETIGALEEEVSATLRARRRKGAERNPGRGPDHRGENRGVGDRRGKARNMRS